MNSEFKAGDGVVLNGNTIKAIGYACPKGLRTGVVTRVTSLNDYDVEIDGRNPMIYRTWIYPKCSVYKLTTFHMAMLGISDE